MVKKFWCAGSSGGSGWFGVLTGVTLLLAVSCFLFHTGELYAGGFALSGVGSKAIGMG